MYLTQSTILHSCCLRSKRWRLYGRFLAVRKYHNPLLSAALLLGLNLNALDYDLLVGVSLDYRSIGLYDKQFEGEIARLETGRFTPAPSVSLRSAPHYLFDHSNWAYLFALDWTTSTLSKQRYIDDSSGKEVVSDTGTRLDGLSLFITPMFYYQFNRYHTDAWQYRAGAGAGLGYQNYHGTVRITDIRHPDTGKLVTVNHNGANLSTGIYLEAHYQRHHIIFEGNLLATSDGSYRYLENSVGITYLYRLFSFSFE